MRKIALMLVFGVMAVLCHAEPRWCSLVGNDRSNMFYYPPIARAARVQGVVLAHMIYVPNGKVVRVEPISGPRLLSDSLANELRDWTVKTDATGDELCETLVIAKFALLDTAREPPEEPTRLMERSILRLSIERSPLSIDMENIDPAPLRGWARFRFAIRSNLRKAFCPKS